MATQTNRRRGTRDDAPSAAALDEEELHALIHRFAPIVYLPADDKDTAQALVRARHLPGSALIELQFWFPMGEHRGHWQHITLRIDSQSSNLHSVYLSQHSGGQWLMVPGQDLEWQSGRPVVYASRSGYAASLGPGPCSDTERGKALDCAAQYRVVSTELLPPEAECAPPSRVGYMRLQQRPYLAMAADPTGQGVSLVSFNPADPAQRWLVTNFTSCCTIKSVSRNLLLSAPSNHAPAVLVDLSQKDYSSLWTQQDAAFRPVRDDSQNLQVLDDARPGPVGVWSSSGGAVNETWQFSTVVSTPWPLSTTQVVVQLAKRPCLVLTHTGGSPVLATYAGPGTPSQIWNKLDVGHGIALINQGTGMALCGPNANGEISAVPAGAIDSSAVWTQIGAALRPVRNGSQNLNVAGDGNNPVPGQVVTSPWSGGHASECWSLTPVMNAPALKAPVGYLRLAKSGGLGLTIAGGQVKLAAANPSDPAQRWRRVEFTGWGYQLVNHATGQAISAPSNHSGVQLVDPAHPDGSSIWTSRDSALRPWRDESQSLSVAGDDENPAIGSDICVSNWSGGSASETWIFVVA